MPILMIGVRRSGSNLLRVMLNEAPGIVAPHPPHILLRMTPLVPLYGHLADSENFMALVEDVCRLVELNPVPWEGVTLDRGDIARRCRSRTLVAIFGAIYDCATETWAARDWVCKSLENIHHLGEVESYFSDPKYIYLYRDGRDVAASMRKAIIGEKHVYHIAREWMRVQRLALGHRASIPPRRFISVSYEELTGQPEATIGRLCAFLSVSYNERMLQFHTSDEARRTAESSGALWGNVAKPLMTNNTRKFVRELSEEEIGIFESIAGDELDALGYERIHVARGRERKFTDVELRRFDAENERLKEEILRATDAGELERRDRQEALLAEIRRPRARARGVASL
jgi:Sulfotransferase family